MDIHEIAALLHIEEKTRAHPTLKEIHDAAMMELQKHNAEYLPQPPEAAEPTTAPVGLMANDGQEPGTEADYDDDDDGVTNAPSAPTARRRV